MRNVFVLAIVAIFLSCFLEENRQIDYSKDFSLELNIEHQQDTSTNILEKIVNFK